MKTINVILGTFLIFTSLATQCEDEFPDPIPVSLKSLEAFNVNNEGKEPFVTEDNIRKEAFMIGLSYVSDTAVDKYTYVIQPIKERKFYCTTDFNEEYPAGSDISSFFMSAKYIPENLNEGYVLLTIPSPGLHTFKMVFICEDGKIVECDTPPVNLY